MQVVMDNAYLQSEFEEIEHADDQKEKIGHGQCDEEAACGHLA